MLGSANTFIYKAFGLSIRSEISFPELLRISNHSDIADISIYVEDLSNYWNDLGGKVNKFIIQDNLVMFHLTNIGIFLVQNGVKIIVSPEKRSTMDQIRLYLLGTCMGALLMQRKVLPLHGSAVAINGKAYVFTGDSGAGKSTLAATFLNRGYHLLSDDVIAIRFKENNTPVVIPAYPQQKLWQESLTQFGMEASKYRSIYGRETKFCIPISTQFADETLPLAGVFEIMRVEKGQIKLNHIEGLEGLRTLSYHTYRNFLIRDMGLLDWHFRMITKLVHHLEIFRIERPTNEFTANHLASLILEVANNPSNKTANTGLIAENKLRVNFNV